MGSPGGLTLLSAALASPCRELLHSDGRGGEGRKGEGGPAAPSLLPQEAVTFDSSVMNTQPADTVATAAFILPGHPTGEHNAARSPPRGRSNTGLQIAPWPNFSSLLPPESLPAPGLSRPFPGVGARADADVHSGSPPGSQEPGPEGLGRSTGHDGALQHRGQLLRPQGVQRAPPCLPLPNPGCKDLSVGEVAGGEPCKWPDGQLSSPQPPRQGACTPSPAAWAGRASLALASSFSGS